MKMWYALLILLLVYAGGGNAALAQESANDIDEAAGESSPTETSPYRVSLDNRDSRLSFGFYGQISQFDREGESLLAYAAELLASYGLTQKVAIQLGLDQAMSSEGGVTIVYTGIHSAVSYAITGDYIKSNSVLNVNERPTLQLHSGDEPLLGVEAGLDQFFFNGTSRIVPATGFSVGGHYDRTVFGYRASLMARYGMLVISEATVPMMTVGAGILFSF